MENDAEKWIEQFALTAMATYAAVQYDHNCYVGWRDKEQKMNYEEAKHLGGQAYARMIRHKNGDPE